ncbi:Adenine nucleotide alpha hydrolase-like superfamily protein [Forsythia ovata]|uniref:Adenine nucleotide alpha hydrolase-like superfamily protein n=1 Tax=Forsythia ovata TaxID=205694 RepID=A0ABD1U4U6_9LAMI
MPSVKQGSHWEQISNSWCANTNSFNEAYFGGGLGPNLKQMEGFNNSSTDENIGLLVMKKRVMVVVDQSSHSKHAMIWALTHVTNKGDILTLLQIVSPCISQGYEFSSPCLATSLGSLCKACKPEVEVEALVIQGPKMDTIMSQVKKLEVSVLVLGLKNSHPPLLNCLCLKNSTEEFVEECIDVLECLTIGVRKQTKGVGGYLISTRWHKNFWLLA